MSEITVPHGDVYFRKSKLIAEDIFVTNWDPVLYLCTYVTLLFDNGRVLGILQKSQIPLVNDFTKNLNSCVFQLKRLSKRYVQYSLRKHKELIKYSLRKHKELIKFNQ